MKLKHFLILAAMAALILTTPVLAGDDDSGEEPSFFVMVEGAFTTATGPGGNYALLSPSDDGQPMGVMQGVDMDSATAPRVGFGWNSGSGWWSISWSQWDDDTIGSVSAADPNYLWDTLYHSDEAWDTFEGTASAMRAVDATTIDLTYGRKVFGDDKFSGRWMFGLRHASLDQMLNVEYADLFDGLHLVDLSSEASGIGFVGGVSGSYNLNEHWFVTGGFQYSFMSGDVKAMSYMEDTDVLGTFQNIDADVVTEEDRTFSIMTASASLVWHPTDATYFWAGYEISQWDNVVDTLLFPDDVSEGFVQSDTTGINFDGFKVGVGFTF